MVNCEIDATGTKKGKLIGTASNYLAEEKVTDVEVK